jgi:hypothetical protein
VDKSLRYFSSLYRYGGAEKDNVYFDEKNRVMLMAYRINSIELAERLSLQNRKTEAVQLLDRMLRNITPASYPHDELSMYMAEAYYHAGALDKAARLSRLLADNAKQDIAWINDLGEDKQQAHKGDLQRNAGLLNRLAETAQQAGDQQTAAYLQAGFKEVLPGINYLMKVP